MLHRIHAANALVPLAHHTGHLRAARAGAWLIAMGFLLEQWDQNNMMAGAMAAVLFACITLMSFVCLVVVVAVAGWSSGGALFF
jgi:hypothetical protein